MASFLIFFSRYFWVERPSSKRQYQIEPSRGKMKIIDLRSIHWIVVWTDNVVDLHSKKQNARYRECYICFGCETEIEVVRIFAIFQDRPVFRHII